MGLRFVTMVAVCSLASRVLAQADAPSPPAPDAPRPIAPLASPAPVAAGPTRPVGDSAPSQNPEPSSIAGRYDSSGVLIHGFVSAGGFLSTANEYIGTSSRGSLKLFEAGINFTLNPIDELRVGLQVVARSVGTLSEDVPRLDWAIIDYRFTPWVGLRAGVIRIPLGLYNEYVDIDSARTAILMPQSLYPIRNRDALISHIGFAAYGNTSIGGAGELDYQAWLGALSIPRSALELSGGTLDSVDTKYVTGGQVFWHPPLDGLRVGASYIQASIDFNIILDADSVTQLVAAGVVPADYDGKLLVSQRPTGFWVASAEYIAGDWLFAAEYSRWLKHQQTSLPQVIPAFDDDAERFYAMATYRLSPSFELGTYYAVTHADAKDRGGKSAKFKERFEAFQRDLALSLRFDVNDYWLWKAEAHFIDGVAELQTSRNADPERQWGLFLFRTTVTF